MSLESNTKSKYKHRQFHFFSSVKQQAMVKEKHNKHKTNITPEMEKKNIKSFVRWVVSHSRGRLFVFMLFFYVFLFRLSLIFESNLHERWVISVNKEWKRRNDLFLYERKAMVFSNYAISNTRLFKGYFGLSENMKGSNWFLTTFYPSKNSLTFLCVFDELWQIHK